MTIDMADPSTSNPPTGPRAPGRHARQHLLEQAAVRKARPILAAVGALVGAAVGTKVAMSFAPDVMLWCGLAGALLGWLFGSGVLRVLALLL